MMRQELSPVELTQAALARISALNPRLNAFITVLEDTGGMRQEEFAPQDRAIDGVEILDEKVCPLPNQTRMLTTNLAIRETDGIIVAAAEGYVVSQRITLASFTTCKNFYTSHS